MLLAAVASLFLQTPAKTDTVGEALRFFARHQRPEGSWGERPNACRCRQDEMEGTCDAPTLDRVLRTLDDDDPFKREAAATTISGLGERALPHLRERAKDADPQIRDLCLRQCRRIEFATPGTGDVELTGLALLTFLGAGYTPLSKDVQDGTCFGEVVRRGLRWLKARQADSGSFDSKDGVADAIAALAMSEAHGWTNLDMYKEPAQQAIDRLAAAPAKDVRALLWKGMALKSAEIGGLTCDGKIAARNLERLGQEEGALVDAGVSLLSMFVHKTRNDPRLESLQTLDPTALPTEALYFADLAAYSYDGPAGPVWKAWYPKVKARVLPAQILDPRSCARGSWDGRGFRGRVRGTALQALMFEIYYIYGVER